ncbi:hypothetical protein THAOC_28098 [Thalassiosira oceanica]|uniref:Uncharacterized protein n=1 Tax=Thalassiosira oceanica TaxID=159749 RepID=K0RFW1_THAOC|nr:hypothetical protein THAOC_28098 [Thalassiosira oceanica]|eukprot:EJK52608.1 hypothetical protein THAOC_28098 [Thalassiosira oceanica]
MRAGRAHLSNSSEPRAIDYVLVAGSYETRASAKLTWRRRGAGRRARLLVSIPNGLHRAASGTKSHRGNREWPTASPPVAADGHATNGHATDGHATDGHATDGHAAAVQTPTVHAALANTRPPPQLQSQHPDLGFVCKASRQRVRTNPDRSWHPMSSFTFLPFGAKVCPSFLPTKACNRTVALSRTNLVDRTFARTNGRGPSTRQGAQLDRGRPNTARPCAGPAGSPSSPSVPPKGFRPVTRRVNEARQLKN